MHRDARHPKADAQVEGVRQFYDRNTPSGVTLSPVQASLARRRIDAAGLSDRVACVEADYTRLPAAIREVDVAYAIESFVHGPSAESFLGECARVIRRGGLLIICDDFRRS